jgi:hypothetical protein
VRGRACGGLGACAAEGQSKQDGREKDNAHGLQAMRNVPAGKSHSPLRSLLTMSARYFSASFRQIVRSEAMAEFFRNSATKAR